MFQSLTGRLQTGVVRNETYFAPAFQSLTGRLQTLEESVGGDEGFDGFNPSQVGYKPAAWS